jgi:hypothetical protein
MRVATAVGADQDDPASERVILGVLGGARGTSQPTLRRGLVVEIGQVPDAELDPDHRCLVGAAFLLVEREGAFPVADRRMHVSQPPADSAEPVVRLGRPACGRSSGELLASLLPPTRGRGAAGSREIGVTHEPMVLPKRGPGIGQLTDVASARRIDAGTNGPGGGP